MSSNAIAYGEPLSMPETKAVEPEDRATDWPLAVVVFSATLAIYAGLGYTGYVIVRSLL